MQEQTIEIKGKKLAYRTAGSGPCVVLLHGFGEDGRIWEDQVPALKNFQLLIPDLPCTGASEMMDDMSMEGLAAAVYHLLQHLNIERCAFIGHSMGGYIALAFLEKYGQMLSALGLFHSSAYADSEEKKATRKKGIDFIEKNGGARFLETTIPNLYSPATQKENPQLIQAHIELMKGASGAALVHYYRSMMERPDRTQLLLHTKIPLLFVLGKWDTAVPPADGLAQVHLPGEAQVHLLQSSGHMGMREEPQLSGAVLQDFLAGVRFA